MKRRISIARKTLARRGRTAGLGLALLSGFAASVHAFDDQWTGTTSGDWNTGTNWSTGVPGGADTATISVTTNNPVTISGVNPLISGLTLSNNTNSLNVGAGLSLEVQGAAAAISNAGTITLGGGSAELRTSGGGTITLTDIGSIVLGGDGNNLIRDPFSATGKLVNVGNTISGVGNIGDTQLSLDNQAAGTISANVSGKTLTIQPNGSGVSNEGLMQATTGGTLELLNGTFTNTGGTYQGRRHVVGPRQQLARLRRHTRDGRNGRHPLPGRQRAGHDHQHRRPPGRHQPGPLPRQRLDPAPTRAR